MLIVTERGHYFTSVEDREDPGMLYVRSQDRASIEDLANRLQALTNNWHEIIEQPDWDYQFRCHLTRGEWALYLGDAAERIEAYKLKPAVAAARGADHPVSHAVFDFFMETSRNRPDGSLPVWLRP